MNKEILLKSFIGENYDKFVSKKFFFPAFFFGGAAFINRKMYVLGIAIYLAESILTSLINLYVSNGLLSFTLFILTSVICAIAYGPLYMKFANAQVDKIIAENANDEETLINICKTKGGTNVGYTILIVIACSIIVGSFLPDSSDVDFSTKTNTTNEYDSEFNTNNNIIENNTININSTTSSYNGILMTNSSINLKDKLTISIPEVFDEGFMNENYIYDYEYDTDGEGVFDECEISLQVVSGYSDSKKLIKEIAEYNSATATVQAENINNMSWSTFLDVDSMSNTYYAATTKDGLVYLFKYSIGSDVKGNPNEYIKYYNSTLNSIIFK